jgi:hypothetical protein
VTRPWLAVLTDALAATAVGAPRSRTASLRRPRRALQGYPRRRPSSGSTEGGWPPDGVAGALVDSPDADSSGLPPAAGNADTGDSADAEDAGTELSADEGGSGDEIHQLVGSSRSPAGKAAARPAARGGCGAKPVGGGALRATVRILRLARASFVPATAAAASCTASSTARGNNRVILMRWCARSDKLAVLTDALAATARRTSREPACGDDAAQWRVPRPQPRRHSRNRDRWLVCTDLNGIRLRMPIWFFGSPMARGRSTATLGRAHDTQAPTLRC